MICVSGLENLRLTNYPAGMSILSENIKAIRLSQSETGQTEFGEKVGASQSTVARWEKGSDPRPENLLALAKLADISVEQLITTPISMIPKRKDGDLLPNDSDFERIVSAALQEVPPGTPLSGYPRIVASSLRDHLTLLLKHGGYRDSSAASTAPDIGAPPPAPTKKGGQAKSRTP